MEIQENNKDTEINQISKDISLLKEIANDTRKILLQQGDQLNNMQEQIDQTSLVTEKAVSEVKIALDYKPNILTPLTCGLVGLAITGPIGIGLGLSGITLSALCSAGALLGIAQGTKN